MSQILLRPETVLAFQIAFRLFEEDTGIEDALLTLNKVESLPKGDDTPEESVIRRKQYGDNWTFLRHSSLPTNVDGLAFHITERGGRFLFIEVKRGEDTSGGQHRLLKQLAQLLQFDVIVVHSLMDEPDDKNCRRVIPYAIQRYDSKGNLGDKEACDPYQFKLIYHQWFRVQKRAELPV